MQRKAWLGILTVAAVALALYAAAPGGARPGGASMAVPAPSLDNPKAAGTLQTAVLAGGCFWGVQAVYEHVQGVRKVVSGYSGGEKSSAEYETVSTGTTGHAESVQISFDPREVSFGEILQIYFSVVHDPTQLNRQDPDTGPQYRSNIFYTDPSQKKIAESYIAQLNKAKVFSRSIATRVDPLKAFYPAEDYHQDFLIHNPDNPYIATFDVPKIANLKAAFPVFYRGEPVMVH
jgi:peptide-methionine (S)-S-oxide reductase